jgi:hypothetical protein
VKGIRHVDFIQVLAGIVKFHVFSTDFCVFDITPALSSAAAAPFGMPALNSPSISHARPFVTVEQERKASRFEKFPKSHQQVTSEICAS